MQYQKHVTRNILGVTCAAALLSLVPMTATAQHAAGLQADAAIPDVPPAAWLQQDPGDSIYKSGREALNRGQYRQAVEHFRQLRGRYPQSGYAADAYYWEAFALDRLGSMDDLRSALEVLDEQARRYETAATLKDAEILATRPPEEQDRGVVWKSWWKHWAIAIILVCVLAMEWWIRRRNGLI